MALSNDPEVVRARRIRYGMDNNSSDDDSSSSDDADAANLMELFGGDQIDVNRS